MLWVKAMHVVFMVTWFAALFYLPRLFVYHAMSSDAVSYERFVVMERKLLWGIMTPGAALTIAFGSWLAIDYGWDAFAAARWLHVKIGCVALLVGYHAACAYYARQFAYRRNRRSHKFYRVFNELPVFLLVAIVVLVIVRPL